MQINEFISIFTGIRVAMNWELLVAKAPKIVQSKISTRNELGKLITACRTKNGNYADGWNDDAEILKVKSKNFPNKFEVELTKNQNASSIPNNFYLPTYKIPDGHLILDANHRAVALYRSGIIPNFCMISIEGPICRCILPDLGKWETHSHSIVPGGLLV